MDENKNKANKWTSKHLIIMLFFILLQHGKIQYCRVHSESLVHTVHCSLTVCTVRHAVQYSHDGSNNPFVLEYKIVAYALVKEKCQTTPTTFAFPVFVLYEVTVPVYL